MRVSQHCDCWKQGEKGARERRGKTMMVWTGERVASRRGHQVPLGTARVKEKEHVESPARRAAAAGRQTRRLAGRQCKGTKRGPGKRAG